MVFCVGLSLCVYYCFDYYFCYTFESVTIMEFDGMSYESLDGFDDRR